MSEYTHILVPVDLRQHSHIVLKRAAFTAALHKARMTVLHVVEYLPLDPVGDTLSPTPMEVTDELAKQAESRLAELCEELSIQPQHQIVRIGATQDEIVEVAKEQQADLIVIGNHERHGIGVLFSRTEDRVLHSATCDILAVHLPTD
ncbi:universal stress protein [Abyssibacter profundi]|uniref:Universal stress protein n=1 Tax=Abyssibacter profundi TaxID=2182787 RepID=A0A363UQA3_9GAMM|nr:universal stress protein [Abyssibacter profundi]MBV59990.1 universal stress protein A [Nevskiales bacterium]PWN57638.1 universal stress protein [Abyssibacter profundi]